MKKGKGDKHGLQVFLRMAGRPVVIVGAGPAADAQRRLLQRAGAHIVGEGSKAALAVVVDDLAAVSRLKVRGALVYVVDRPDLSDFIPSAVAEPDPVPPDRVPPDPVPPDPVPVAVRSPLAPVLARPEPVAVPARPEPQPAARPAPVAVLAPPKPVVVVAPPEPVAVVTPPEPVAVRPDPVPVATRRQPEPASVAPPPEATQLATEPEQAPARDAPAGIADLVRPRAGPSVRLPFRAFAATVSDVLTAIQRRLPNARRDRVSLDVVLAKGGPLDPTDAPPPTDLPTSPEAASQP